MGQVTGGSAPAPREHSLLLGTLALQLWAQRSYVGGIHYRASSKLLFFPPSSQCLLQSLHSPGDYTGLHPQFSSLVLPMKTTRWRCFTTKQTRSVLAPGPPQDAASWLFLPFWYPRAPLAPSTGYFCSQCQQGSPSSSPDPIPIPLFLQDCAQSSCFCKLHLAWPASFTCSWRKEEESRASKVYIVFLCFMMVL